MVRGGTFGPWEVTEIRPHCIIKVVVCAMEGWCMVVGVSPFAVGVVGGKGGVVMMMVRGAGLGAQLIERGA